MALLLFALACGLGWGLVRARLRGQAPRFLRAHVEPLTLLCDDRQFEQASAAATWPAELRRRLSAGNARVCLAVGPGVEFFPRWDEVVRRRGPEDVSSHVLRHRQRALARARPCGALPSGRAGDLDFPCPDPRVLVGCEALVDLALALSERPAGACLAAFRLGLWICDSGLKLKTLDAELGFVPTADGSALEPLPSSVEEAVAALEVGNGPVVLPALRTDPDAAVPSGWAA